MFYIFQHISISWGGGRVEKGKTKEREAQERTQRKGIKQLVTFNNKH